MLLPITKLGIVVVSSSALAAGTYGVVYLSGSSMKSLHDTKEYSGNISSNKFGDEFSYYFLATKGNANLKIWEARAKILKDVDVEDNTKEFFKDIKENPSANSLRKKCGEKYNENFPTNHMQRWKGVWIYCSVGGMRPKTISESGQYKGEDESSNILGKLLRNKLISTKDPLNQWFWNIRQREFKNGDLKTDPASPYFSTNTTETLQKMCERAYDMQASETSTTTNPSKSEVEKYCAIRKVEQVER